MAKVAVATTSVLTGPVPLSKRRVNEFICFKCVGAACPTYSLHQQIARPALLFAEEQLDDLRDHPSTSRPAGNVVGYSLDRRDGIGHRHTVSDSYGHRHTVGDGYDNGDGIGDGIGHSYAIGDINRNRNRLTNGDHIGHAYADCDVYGIGNLPVPV